MGEDRRRRIRERNELALAAGQSAAAEPAETIYIEHGPVMRRLAIRRFNVPRSVADELVHNVFVNYLLTPTRVHTDVRAYLIGGISNACRNYWRSRHTEGKVFSGYEPDEKTGRDESIFEGLATSRAVAAMLEKLSPRCREALRRYYLRDEDTPTIAAALSTSPGNVNYLMHKCRKEARAVYEAMMRMQG